MHQHRQTKRFCTYMVLLALCFRLTLEGVPQMLFARVTQPELLPFLIYLETGRDVRFSSSVPTPSDFCRESPPPVTGPVIPSFSPEDAGEVEVFYSCSVSPDLGQLLAAPISWDLTGQEPTVLILHTHTTESYTKAGESYEESSAYRTLDEDYNMLSMGALLARELENRGISVLQDRSIHDYPSYNGSYSHARASVKKYLEQYPSIRLILDLHRDASGTTGKQMRTETTVQGRPSAQLMLVVGTDASSLRHEHWQENLSLALKLQLQLQRSNPGIVRPLNLRAQRFNQDLLPGMLLVEVGAAGNTHAEAEAAIWMLAEAIESLSRGTDIS